MISARNQIKVEISEVKTGAVNSLIVGKMAGGEILKATVTTDIFLFKASSVIIAKGQSELKLSATNQIKGKISALKEGVVNTSVDVEVAGGDKISAIITNESLKGLDLKVGDSVTALIKATQIIVGVKA